MHKQANLTGFDRYASAVQTLHDHHLQTWAAFLLGYDQDTPDSMLAQCDWAIEQRFTFAAWNVLMPYPGTELYARLLEQGRLLYDGRWSSLGSIVRRAFDRSTNMNSLTRLALYVVYNPLFRREAFKRQGLRQGLR